MSEKKSNNVTLRLNTDERCILDFDGSSCVRFMDAIFTVLLSEVKHMQTCENCAEARNLTPAQLNDIILFTENLLNMRGYERQMNDQPLH